jgi:phospholipase/lecithinase/hemolysin
MQFQHFLRDHKRFAPQDLVILWIGGNDTLSAFDPERSKVRVEALNTVQILPTSLTTALQSEIQQYAVRECRLVQSMLAHGANRLVVLNVIDTGVPFGPNVTPIGLRHASMLVDSFNSSLRRCLPHDSRVLFVDINVFVQNMARNPAQYGYENVKEDACAGGGLLPCGPANYTTPNASDTYLFAEWGHFTQRTRQLIADHVHSEVVERWGIN